MKKVMVWLIITLCLVSCANNPDGRSAEAGDERTSARGTASYPAPVGGSPSGSRIFTPAPLGNISIPLEVGVFAPGESPRNFGLADELSELFRSAYLEAILMETPLAGVLGGDQIHRWPPNAAKSWAQNWHGLVERHNSWALPPLVLAVKSGDLGRVFVMEGAFLDFYGHSAGVNMANGVAGYGTPRTGVFFHNGSAARRFDLGLMIEDKNGTITFIPEAPPSLEAEPPPLTGRYNASSGAPDGASPDTPSGAVSQAFIDAWKIALDQGYRMAADGPVRRYDLGSSPWPLAGTPFSAKEIYIQSFNGASAALVIAVMPGLPSVPRLIAGPVLAELTRAQRQSGAFARQNVAEDSLMSGLALYGVPLTDQFPQDGKIRQRFSAGWMEYPADRTR